MTVRVQEADFDVGAELQALTQGNRRIGGIATFIGLVRERHVREGYHRDQVDALTLEHYPGMTERALEEIEAEEEAEEGRERHRHRRDQQRVEERAAEPAAPTYHLTTAAPRTRSVVILVSVLINSQ